MIRRGDGRVVRALTIAGSDSGGGAGIQADLKTMHQLGVYGMSVLTAVTAQNTRGVAGVYELAPEFVVKQLTAVLDDLGTDAVKTGMLASAAIVGAVAQFLREHQLTNAVVGPVMVAKGGATLLSSDAIDVVKRELLPLTRVVTPNLPEASFLSGYPIRSVEDAERAAREIARMGPGYVVIKGGHTFLEAETESGDAVDVVYEAGSGEFTYLAAARLNTRNTHGTGCTFSAAIAAFLAKGFDPLSAIAGAKAFVTDAIRGAAKWNLGSGHGPTNHFAAEPGEYHPTARLVNQYKAGQWIVSEERSR